MICSVAKVERRSAMRKITICGILFTALACAQINSLTSQESKDGWTLLFNGKSLNGWQSRPTSDKAAAGDWSVANGTLICGGTMPSWLGTDATFSNFNLKLEFRGPAKVNRGVFLRSA